MAKLGVLVSGRGTNCRAIAERIKKTPHSISCLIHDRKEAGARVIAREYSIPVYHVSYYGRDSVEAEKEILKILFSTNVDLIALAGFMRILSPHFIDTWKGQILNVHPALLPRHPGTQGIKDSYTSRDRELGITIHHVDYGVDTGPIIRQESFIRRGTESLEEIEEKIHRLEHLVYPDVIIEHLDKLT